MLGMDAVIYSAMFCLTYMLQFPGGFVLSYNT